MDISGEGALAVILLHLRQRAPHGYRQHSGQQDGYERAHDQPVPGSDQGQGASPAFHLHRTNAQREQSRGNEGISDDSGDELAGTHRAAGRETGHECAQGDERYHQGGQQSQNDLKDAEDHEAGAAVAGCGSICRRRGDSQRRHCLGCGSGKSSAGAGSGGSSLSTKPLRNDETS